MHHFRYVGPNLHCESVDLAAVARFYGTPTYVYSRATMEENFGRLSAALGGLDHRICFAMKANSNLAVLRVFARLGASFDLVSGGELRRVQAVGGAVGESVFAGVGKTEAEIAMGIEAGVAGFHVESQPEIERINRVASQMGRRAPVALRINPDVDADTHHKITTGKSENKFGIPLVHAEEAYAFAARLKNIEIRGVQMHIGSQITKVEPFVNAVEKLLPFVTLLKSRHGIGYFSIGGGIGIVYEDALASGAESWWSEKPSGSRPLTPEAYGTALVPLLKPLGLRILLEPGRFLVGNAGALVTRVEYLKRGDGRNFLIVDAAMNDLVRPSMYEAYHEIVPLARDPSRKTIKADIVGPICESGDVFAKDREIQESGEGELIALLSAGAYGHVMASRYNTRGIPAEVLASGTAFDLVNERETFERMIAGERIPPSLK